MEIRIARRITALSVLLATTIAHPVAVHADSWANSNTYTNTYTYSYSFIETNTNTNTVTNTNTMTCTWNGVPIDCVTREPLPITYTNPAENCPERRFEVIYGRYCDYRITTLKYRPVQIQHAYDGAGFNAGTGLTNARSMNDNGDIVGQAVTPNGEKHAVQLNIGPVYFSNHYFTDLGTPGLNSIATAISNELTVAGASQPSMGTATMVDAVWHSQLGGFTLLNSLGSDTSRATGLARNSMYTEYMSGFGLWPTSQGGDGLEHGFVWTFDGRNRTVHIIGASGQTNRALAINDSQLVVGFTMDNGKKNASLWNGTGLMLLPDFGHYTSVARAINNNRSAKIVGFAFDTAGKKRAMLWQGITFTVLPGLTNYAASMATSISDGGDIVGQSASRAVFWRNNVVYDLNTLLDSALPTTLVKAIDINRHGRILAQGADGAFYVLIPSESI